MASTTLKRPRSFKPVDHVVEGYDRRVKRICSNPLDRLCDLLLPWDFYAELTSPSAITSIDKLLNVPLSFSCYMHYISVWEPLMLEEMRRSILSSFLAPPSSSAVCKRLAGHFQFSLPDKLAEKSVTLQGMFTVDGGDDDDDGRGLTPMDLVLLSAQSLQLLPGQTHSTHNTNTNLAAKPTSTPKSMLGLVQGVSFNAQGIKLTHLTLPTQVLSALTPSLPRSKEGVYKMHCVFVDGVRPMFRDFEAMHEVGETPYWKNIQGESSAGEGIVDMPATPPPPPDSPPTPQQTTSSSSPLIAPASLSFPAPIAATSADDVPPSDLPAPFLTYLHTTFNPSQLRAIWGVVRGGRDGRDDKEKLALIQGPPGTGKSTTLVGILNALHLRNCNFYYRELVGALCAGRHAQTDLLTILESLSSQLPRLLVLCPSHSALDLLLVKIATGGFADGSGGRYFPPLVRLIRSVAVGVGEESANAGATGRGRRGAVKTAFGLDLDTQISKYLSLSPQDLDRQIRKTEEEVARRLKEVGWTRGALLHLIRAFNTHPLPRGWEVRVNLEGGGAYWVDHNLKTTSPHPPPAPAPDQPRAYARLSDLPEHAALSARLAQGAEEVRKVRGELNRLMTCKKAKAQKGRGAAGEDVRSALEFSLLFDAQLIFSTLNSAGGYKLDSLDFSACVLDEGGQCTEPGGAIALKRGGKQVVIVGDPQQLPPTVLSEPAKKKGYGMSLLERLMRGGYPYRTLDTQYRMTPSISAFPNHIFYHGRLKDGANVLQATYLPGFVLGGLAGGARGGAEIGMEGALLPFVFFDLVHGKDILSQSSRVNQEEGVFSMNLLSHIVAIIDKVAGIMQASNAGNGIHKPPIKIGIITPYAEQLSSLRRRFASSTPTLPPGISIHWGTVDGFQGAETDVVIFSTVRANDQKSIGFLSDYRRMNVALTRAKALLCVLGSADTLRGDDVWGALVGHAERQDALVRVESGLSVEESLRRKAWYTPMLVPPPSSHVSDNAGGMAALQYSSARAVPNHVTSIGKKRPAAEVIELEEGELLEEEGEVIAI